MKDLTEEFNDGLGEGCRCDTDETCTAFEHDCPREVDDYADLDEDRRR